MGGRFAAGALCLFLTGCGGGSDDPDRPGMVTWNGSVNGEVVKDANGDSFRVTSSSRCLWSDQHQMVVTNWCRIGGDTSDYRLWFVNRYVSVRYAKLANGACGTSLVDDETGLMVDIFRDTAGVMQYTLSTIQPAAC